MFQVEGTWAGALHWGKAFRVLRKAKEAGVESGKECEEVRLSLANHGDGLGYILNATGGCCSILSSIT